MRSISVTTIILLVSVSLLEFGCEAEDFTSRRRSNNDTDTITDSDMGITTDKNTDTYPGANTDTETNTGAETNSDFDSDSETPDSETGEHDSGIDLAFRVIVATLNGNTATFLVNLGGEFEIVNFYVSPKGAAVLDGCRSSTGWETAENSGIHQGDGVYGFSYDGGYIAGDSVVAQVLYQNSGVDPQYVPGPDITCVQRVVFE